MTPPSAKSRRRAKRKREEAKEFMARRKKNRQRKNELKGNKPDTVHDCPICRTGVTLRNAMKHLDHHVKHEKVPSSLKDEISRLRSVARKVTSAYKDIEKEQKSNNSGNNSEDLWDRNRPVSGGGANGTGKKR